MGGFFCPKTPCSYFHGCVQRGVLCSATMDEGNREVRILHETVIIIIFFSYHLTCYFSFIVYHLAHAREEANKEVRSRTVLDKTTCERLHDKLIVLNLIDIYKRFRFSIHDQTSMYAARVSSTHIWRWSIGLARFFCFAPFSANHRVWIWVRIKLDFELNFSLDYEFNFELIFFFTKKNTS